MNRPNGIRASIVVLTMALFCLVAIGIAPDDASAAKKKMKKAGAHGYLGITMQSLTEDIVEGLDLKVKRGVLISEVMEDSPAEEAGLEDGDVIVSYDGNKVSSSTELAKMVKATEAGEEVKLKIIRDNDTRTLVATIGEQPDEFAWTFKGDDHKIKDVFIKAFRPGVQLGVKIQDLKDDDFAAYFDVDGGEGVLVMGVEEESAAEEAGVKAGDVILSLNDEDIGSSEELIETVRDMEAGDEFELVVKRHGRAKKLTGVMKEGNHFSSWHAAPGKIGFLGDGDFSFHMDDDQIEALVDKTKRLKFRCERKCDHDDDEECTDDCKRIYVLRDKIGLTKDKLKTLDKHIIIKEDELREELKELKEELRKLKKRLEKIEE